MSIGFKLYAICVTLLLIVSVSHAIKHDWATATTYMLYIACMVWGYNFGSWNSHNI